MHENMSFWNMAIIAVVLLAALGGFANIVVSTGLLTKGLRSEYLNRLDATQTIYQDLCTILKSNASIENYRWLGTVPQVRPWGDGRLPKGLRSESYAITNQKYEASIEVDRDELSDDQTGQISIRIQELAIRAKTHPDYLLAQLLINGATAGFNSYDGVPFFNDAHVSGASGSQDNNLGYDAATAAAATVAEFQAAISQAIAAIMGFKDDQGEPMNLGQSGFVIAVSPANYFNAVTAMSAAVINNTNNLIQVLGLGRVIQLPWLTDATKFYTLKTDGVVRPFVFQDREPLEFTALDSPGSEEGFKREKYLYGVRARYAMTYGYWQHAVLTTFT